MFSTCSQRFAYGLALFALLSSQACSKIRLDGDLRSPSGMGRAETLADVELRNRTVEDDPLWSGAFQHQLFVRELSQVPAEEYTLLGSYLDNGAAYVIVHPAFYTYFHDWQGEDPSSPLSNALEISLAAPKWSAVAAVGTAQDKALRDFLEIATTQERLVLLVLPHSDDTPRGRAYRRFVNEVTNASPSVVVVYSRSPDEGELDAVEARRLARLWTALDKPTLRIGGGYVGRCIAGFQASVSDLIDPSKLEVLSDLSAISPDDLGDDAARRLLRPDGSLDVDRATTAMFERGLTGPNLARLARLSDAKSER